jgi:hypothetical protein
MACVSRAAPLARLFARLGGGFELPPGQRRDTHHGGHEGCELALLLENGRSQRPGRGTAEHYAPPKTTSCWHRWQRAWPSAAHGCRIRPLGGLSEFRGRMVPVPRRRGLFGTDYEA